MKAWLVEIFVCHYEDEYGYVSCYYRDSKVFNNEKDAKKYLKNFRKDFEANPRKYDMWGDYEDESTIKVYEL